MIMLQPTGFPNYFLFFNVEKDNFQLINNSYIYMYMLLRIFFCYFEIFVSTEGEDHLRRFECLVHCWLIKSTYEKNNNKFDFTF